MDRSMDRRGGARTIAVTVAVSTCGVLPSSLTGILAVQMISDLDLTPARLGIVITVSFLSAMLASRPMGVFVARVGWRRALRVAPVVSGVSMLAIGWLASEWTHLLALLAVAGIGVSVSHPAASLALTVWAPPARQGLIFGLKQSAIPIATLLGGVSLPLAAGHADWRSIYMVAGLVAMALSALVTRRQPPRVVAVSASGNARRKRPLKIVTLAAMFAAAAGNAFATFVVLSLVDAGMSRERAGLLVVAGSCFGIGARLAGGWIVDRFSLDPFALVAGLFLLASVAYAGLAIPRLHLMAAATLTSFVSGWGWAGLFNLGVVRLYPHQPAQATATTQIGIFAGAATGPSFFGFLASQAGYTTAWLAVGAFSLVAALLLIRSNVKWSRQFGL